MVQLVTVEKMFFFFKGLSEIPKIFLFFFPFILLLMLSDFAQAQKTSSWRVICENTKIGKVCGIQYELMVQKQSGGKKQTVGRLISAVVQKVKDKKGGRGHVMNLLLPLGTDLQAGIKILIDKGQETSFRYSRCTNTGCLVILPVSKKLLASLKRGKNLKIGFLPFGAAKPMIVNLNLGGFTKQLSRIK